MVIFDAAWTVGAGDVKGHCGTRFGTQTKQQNNNWSKWADKGKEDKNVLYLHWPIVCFMKVEHRVEAVRIDGKKMIKASDKHVKMLIKTDK